MSRFSRAAAEAELTRFLKADFTADRFSWSVDEAALAEAELFDGKLALITNASDLSSADILTRYRALADIERGFRVLTSDIEIAAARHRFGPRSSRCLRVAMCGRSGQFGQAARDEARDNGGFAAAESFGDLGWRCVRSPERAEGGILLLAPSSSRTR